MSDRDQLLRERNAWREEAIVREEEARNLKAEVARLQDAVQERDGVIEMILLRELRLREAVKAGAKMIRWIADHKDRMHAVAWLDALETAEMMEAALAGKENKTC